MIGYISSYNSFATMEGPGIRFAIFMSGCNLRCAYCHNPETWPQGKPYDSDELYKLIVRYKPYFRNGGGVTFSGGEPLTQPDFLIELASRLKESGIHIAMDTSCGILGDKQKRLYELCDLILADLKFHTPQGYNDYCKGNVFGTVIETFRYLNEKNIPVWLRTVIVPEINDTPEDIEKYYAVIKDFGNIEKYELKPFHTMGFSKYAELNIPNLLEGAEGMDMAKLDALRARLDSLMKREIQV